MKAKYLYLVIFSLLILSACNSNSKKEKQPDPKTKETTEVKKAKKPVTPEQPYVYGIDISAYQGNETDVINAHKDTLGFVFCKATQGAYFTDPKFKDNWPQIKKDGFIRGAYHFYMAQNDPVLQAKLFATTVGKLEPTDLPPVIDFEGGGMDASKTVEETVSGLIVFIETLEKELGKRPMIYTDIPTADKYLVDAKFSAYALWIANYTNAPQPDLPNTWKSAGWTFWQRDADYKLDNFTDDSDVFNGDITKLKDFIANYQ